MAGTRQLIIETLYGELSGMGYDELIGSVGYLGGDDSFEALLRNLIRDKQIFLDDEKYYLSDKAKTRMEMAPAKRAISDELGESIDFLERMARAFNHVAADMRRVKAVLERARDGYDNQH